MRLCTDTGSLVNHIISSSAQVEPYVGMPATLSGWSDRYPATVIFVQGLFIAVQEDSYKGVAGHCNAFTESQKWEYERNSQGSITWFKRTEQGNYIEHRFDGIKGTFRKVKSGSGLFLGRREKYVDPSF